MKNRWMGIIAVLFMICICGCQTKDGAGSPVVTPTPEVTVTATPTPMPEPTATSTPTPVITKEERQGIVLTTYQWEENGYCPEVIFYPELTEDGIRMEIIVKEQDPRREMTEHFQPVYKDSCVEWFVNFTPEDGDAYFNFEVNANGAMNAEFHKNQKSCVSLTLEEVGQLNIQTKVEDTQWSVEYLVPFSLIGTYFEGFELKEEVEILTNFYKCGDDTEFPHYGVWNPIDVSKPNFHRPEFFGELTLRMEE